MRTDVRSAADHDPNQVIYDPMKTVLFKDGHAMTKKLLLTLFLFATVGVFAQQKQSSQVMHISQFLATDSQRAAVHPDAARVAKLIYEVQPTVYVTPDSVNAIGEGTTLIHANAQSLSNLVNVSPAAKNSAEALIIKIESPSGISGTMDLSVLSGFPQMKYVYILSTVEIPASAIVSGITNHSPYIVFYNIEKSN